MESDSRIFAHIFFIVIINMLKKHRTNEMQTKEVWDSSKTSLLQFAPLEHWSPLYQLNIEAHSPFHFLTLSWQSWCHEQSLSARGSTAIDDGIPRLWVNHRNYKTWNRSFMTQHRLLITSSNENYYHSQINGCDKRSLIACRATLNTNIRSSPACSRKKK